jgi:radical SAM protein with 4Fe4S-binding SPASM domain
MNFAEKIKYLRLRVFSYRRTIFFLFKKRGIKAVWNFLYSKLFILAGGEGTDSWAFLPFKPMLRFLYKIKPYIYTYPRQIEIEITLKCNKTCILCEHTYWHEKSEELSLDEFKKIVDQFPKLQWVNLTGEGDAFLNRDYLEMIAYLKKREVSVYLVDSFDLIDEDRARRLIELGVNGIWVSIDAATKETYEKIKCGCDFERSIGNLKRFIELKKEMGSPIPEICFRYIVTKLNVNEMPDLIDLISSLGSQKDLGDGTVIEFVGLLKFSEIEQYYIEDIPLEIVCETIERAKAAGLNVTFSHASPVLPHIKHCAAWSEPYIMMKGYVIPCCAVLQSNSRDFLKKYSFGNLLEKPFEEIWSSKRYKEFRKLVCAAKGPVPIFCKECRAYDTKSRLKNYGASLDI